MDATLSPFPGPSGHWPASANGLATTRRSTTLVAIVGAHLLALIGLASLDRMPAVLRMAAPVLTVSIIPPAPVSSATEAPVERPDASPAPTRRIDVDRSEAFPAAVVADAPVAWPPTPAAMTETTPSLAAEPVVAIDAAPPAAPHRGPATAPPAAPRLVASTAVEYLVRPPVEVPLVSRRLGESGTVWLRVTVGRDGVPQQITVQRGSGYPRLDQQALDAMRQARFKPQTENGQAIEWIVVAPLQYDID